MPRPSKMEAERFVIRSLRFPPDLWKRIQRHVPHRKRSAFIRGAVERALDQMEPGHARDDRPIWEVFEEIASEMPAEEARKIPTDASANIDHYLYGAPKAK